MEPAQLGEGVRQVFPIIRAVTEPVWGGGNKRCVMVQQPELHLHPRMQVGLTDVLIEHRNCTIVETHSEHMILRALRRVRETAAGQHKNSPLAIRPDDISVIYLKAAPVQEVPASNEVPLGVTACRLRISEAGDFLDPWPQGFFEERLEDLFDDQEPQP
jgi:hypothetical protein